MSLGKDEERTSSGADESSAPGRPKVGSARFATDRFDEPRRGIRSLDGIRVLALEQMQALPYATQLLARLGADVVKIEPLSGDLGRASMPSMKDPYGRPVGATFLRNNLNKRSLCLDLKSRTGRELVLKLAPRFDVFAENFTPGVVDRLGVSYKDIYEVHPSVIYASVSGFGNSEASPYRTWPAFAPVVEAMSGIYELKRRQDQPPEVSPVGALGDIGAALFCSLGIMAALRRRDLTGQGDYVDIAMLDAVVAMTDIVTNFWSMGVENGDSGTVINHGFLASDGWFVMQVGREHHFERLVEVIGQPEFAADPRFAERSGWIEHLDGVLRPAVERWASDKTRLEACEVLGEAGIAAGPCLRDDEVADDPHIGARHMLVAIERTDGVAQPVLIPGNPIKFAGIADDVDSRMPWAGEHSEEILRDELGLDRRAVDALRNDGIIS
ncbi:MAG TPA: CoA transferase [Acidimicrobiales bacterium]|nr:CoA transferase [Acidimicrobiales bacterium]